MLTTEQIKLLEDYRDKSDITSILCSQSEEYFSFIRTMVNIPLIFSSSIMTILNSMDEARSNEIKICNIVLNTATATILSLIGNFHLTEQAVNFKAIAIKMTKLCHQIEDKLSIDVETCTVDNLRGFINEYDTLCEQLDYPFPNFIKQKVKKAYQNKMTLPNVLNCESRSSVCQVKKDSIIQIKGFGRIPSANHNNIQLSKSSRDIKSAKSYRDTLDANDAANAAIAIKDSSDNEEEALSGDHRA